MVLALWLAAAGAGAHDSPPAHGCAAPGRPADDQNDVLWQRYLDDVDAFRGCVSDFVEASQAAAAAHGEAARRATQDWNEYVRANLNVPEDYPWPPEQRDATE
jgi:hypothetical protein